jgi:hypothetical protein
MSNFPSVGALVLSKDIDYRIVDYFDRMNIKLEVISTSGKKYTATVGTCYNNVLFCGEGAPDKENYRLQLKEIESVKIIG